LVRKGVLLHKTKNQHVPKTEMENPGNETNVILIHHKVIGYTSDKSDSKADWMEEN
jgi:hypothetical protein